MTQRLITELISFCILANVMIWIIKQAAASFPVSHIQGRVLFCFGERLSKGVASQRNSDVSFKKTRCNRRK